jgi:nitrate reductase beta subunit
MSTLNLKTIAIATILSSIITSAVILSIVDQRLANASQFQVVDIQKISMASMQKLQDKAIAGKIDLKPDVLVLLAQVEAKKMFEQIALLSNNKNIIIPKSSALFTPDGFEITDKVALALGLENITNDSFASRINKASAKLNDK